MEGTNSLKFCSTNPKNDLKKKHHLPFQFQNHLCQKELPLHLYTAAPLKLPSYIVSIGTPPPPILFWQAPSLNLQTVQAPSIFRQFPHLYCFFVNPPAPLKIGFFSETHNFKFFVLNLIPSLRWLVWLI